MTNANNDLPAYQQATFSAVVALAQSLLTEDTNPNAFKCFMDSLELAVALPGVTLTVNNNYTRSGGFKWGVTVSPTMLIAFTPSEAVEYAARLTQVAAVATAIEAIANA